MNNAYSYACLLTFCLVFMLGISQASGEQLKIPSWMRNNAKWWHEGEIQDSEFIKGIQYLIEKKIMIIPSTGEKSNNGNKIPSWVKNDAGWWANGTISDTEFVSSIQYLISSEIILINPNKNSTQNSQETQCNKLATDAERETCLQQLEYDAKVNNDIQTAIPYVIGPVTFYYVGTESQKADDDKTILTIHFVVEDDESKEITMTCQSRNSCNYILSDGQDEIPYSTNTLVYGSMTLVPKNPKFLDWTFYGSIDRSKNYSFLVREPWGTGSIAIKIS